MKYLLLLLLVTVLAGCTITANGATEDKIHMERQSDNIYKFRDGDVVCYTYWDNGGRGGISCLRDATSSGEAR